MWCEDLLVVAKVLRGTTLKLMQIAASEYVMLIKAMQIASSYGDAMASPC